MAARACSVRKGRGEASSPEEEEEARQELAASSSKLAVHPALRVPEKEDSPARRMAGSPWPGHSGREAGAEGEGEEAEDEVVFGANEGDAATFARSVLPLLGASSDEGSGAASCDRATRACPAAQSSSSRASSAKRERKKNGGASRWRWSSCCRRLWREAAAELVRIIAMAAASFESGCRPCSLSNAFLESRARQHGYREMEGRARTGACRDAPQRARLKALPFISSCVEKKTSMQDEKNRRTLIFFSLEPIEKREGLNLLSLFPFLFPQRKRTVLRGENEAAGRPADSDPKRECRRCPSPASSPCWPLPARRPTRKRPALASRKSSPTPAPASSPARRAGSATPWCCCLPGRLRAHLP